MSCPTRPDRLFARFAERGDVQALGEVFDATARELARIAVHLVGDREQARDLVQSAFLIAIEKRAEFVRARRVLPWLCGIVANLARNERRRRQRELIVRPRARAEDPGAAAEAAEFHAAFARAKAELPDVYRPVLELHLEHGMTAAEIGSALGRPAGTVRTQIVRGLELLRQRLPRSFVAGLAVASIGDGALATVRAAVLRSATGVGPLAATTAAGPGVLLGVMGVGAVNPKLVLLGVVGLLLLALGLWGVDALHVRPGDASGAPLAQAALPDPTTAPLDPVVASAAIPQNVRVAEAAPAVGPAASGSLEVLAKWRSDDAPASQQAIEVIYADEVLAELRPRRGVTDAAGCVVIEELRPGTILVQASTGIRRSVEIAPGERAATTLVLDGVPVAGRVVDPRDVPVADADVWVSSELSYALPRGGKALYHGQHGHQTLRTDAQGRFVTRLWGMQCLAAFKESYGPSATLYPLRGLGPTPGPVEVELRLGAQGGGLTVSVRGGDATPVAGALVLAGPEVPELTGEDNLASPPALRATSDAAGVATLSPLPTGCQRLQVRAAGFGPWNGTAEVPVGGMAAIEVVLERGAVVAGVVYDSGGRPLANAMVQSGPEGYLRASSATTDVRGAFRLEHLPAGEVEIVAFHGDWGKVTTQLKLTAGGVQRWDARMPARAAITGLVLDEDGQSASGADVYGFARERGARTAHAVTDGVGRFTLSPLDPERAYELRTEVRTRNGGIAVVQKPAVRPGSDVELRVETAQVPSAWLRGRVLQAGGKPAVGILISASPLDGSPGTLIWVGAGGFFELGPWQPTRVRIHAHRRQGEAPLADFGVHELRVGTTGDLGDLFVPTPGGARVRVTGSFVGPAGMTLFRDGVVVHACPLAAELTWDELAPGHYVACMRGNGEPPAAGLAEFDVVPGQIAEVTVTVFPANRAEVRVEAPAGWLAGPFALRAVDRAGRTVMLDRIWLLRERPVVSILLPDGAAELRITSEEGLRGSAILASPGPTVVKLAQ